MSYNLNVNQKTESVRNEVRDSSNIGCSRFGSKLVFKQAGTRRTQVIGRVA